MGWYFPDTSYEIVQGAKHVVTMSTANIKLTADVERDENSNDAWRMRYLR